MINRSLFSLIVAALAGSYAIGASSVEPQAVYFDGGQYTATLQQHAHHWRLLPMQGDEVDVTDRAATCAHGVHVPRGVWLVSRNQSGQPQLLAPSATTLPTGFPQQIQMRACGDGTNIDDENGAGALLVPAVVLEWIKSNVSSVMIDD